MRLAGNHPRGGLLISLAKGLLTADATRRRAIGQILLLAAGFLVLVAISVASVILVNQAREDNRLGGAHRRGGKPDQHRAAGNPPRRKRRARLSPHLRAAVSGRPRDRRCQHHSGCREADQAYIGQSRSNRIGEQAALGGRRSASPNLPGRSISSNAAIPRAASPCCAIPAPGLRCGRSARHRRRCSSRKTACSRDAPRKPTAPRCSLPP